MESRLLFHAGTQSPDRCPSTPESTNYSPDFLLLFRAEFEISSNSIDVRLHFASHYCVENGALKLIDKDKDTVTLGIDRRRTVGDLRLAIYQVTSDWDMISHLFSTFLCSLQLSFCGEVKERNWNCVCVCFSSDSGCMERGPGTDDC